MTRLAARVTGLPKGLAAYVAALPQRRQERIQDAVLAVAIAAVNVVSLLPYRAQLSPVGQQRHHVDGRDRDREHGVLDLFLAPLRERGHLRRQAPGEPSHPRRHSRHDQMVWPGSAAGYRPPG